MQLYQVKNLKKIHDFVLIFESFKIQTLAGNAVQPLFKKVSHFLKNVISIKMLCNPLSFSLFKKAYLKKKKVF